MDIKLTKNQLLIIDKLRQGFVLFQSWHGSKEYKTTNYGLSHYAHMSSSTLDALVRKGVLKKDVSVVPGQKRLYEFTYTLAEKWK